MKILEHLNDGAADSFQDYSRRDHDLLQENFRPVAEDLCLPGKLFECHPSMKKRYKKRMADFLEILSPKSDSVLSVNDSRFPAVHVDVAKYVQLLLKSPHLQRCVAARHTELQENRRELGREWKPFLPPLPPDDVITARVVMDNAVMYSRAKKQREYDQCAVYLYLSMFGLPSMWSTLGMLALFEGSDGLLNFIAHCHGPFKTQLSKLLGTGMCLSLYLSCNDCVNHI